MTWQNECGFSTTYFCAQQKQIDASFCRILKKTENFCAILTHSCRKKHAQWAQLCKLQYGKRHINAGKFELCHSIHVHIEQKNKTFADLTRHAELKDLYGTISSCVQVKLSHRQSFWHKTATKPTCTRNR